MTGTRRHNTIREMFDRLSATYGPQHWWPADSDIETAVGAILTQNTAWSNVERAIDNLKGAGCLTTRALREVSERRLATLIQPAGTYRVKARRLRAFIDVLWRDHGGSLPALLDGSLEAARARLLAIHGIGKETADAILLYAGRRPIFVVDAYTKRILRRHMLIGDGADYDAVQQILHGALTRDEALFNEYHALLVAVGKQHCRRVARCDGCPLADFPHDGER